MKEFEEMRDVDSEIKEAAEDAVYQHPLGEFEVAYKREQ